ncbi:MAG: ABC transporter permease [Bacteroidota bacterium]
MKKTYLLFKDELLGFARSWVMLFLWIGLPVLAILLYYFQARQVPTGPMNPSMEIPVSFFISLIVASLGGTLAAVMVGVGIVNEKSRKVYDLFIIRPVSRRGLVWAKFGAVFICVAIACVLAIGLGILIDVLRGSEISPMMWKNSGSAIINAVNMIAVSTAGGVLVGVISPNVLIGVLLVIYGSQNLVVVPLLPRLLDLPDLQWVATLLSFGLAGGLMWLAGFIFQRKEF